MAGHSKWANTKHRKMAQDAKKGQAYAKFTREIIMATKLGGPDPGGNFRLRTAIDRAKAVGLPNDTIQSAVAKGAGKISGENLENLVYEGYGPGGVAIYVQAMTDNRNRTAGDVRSNFSKYKGNLGESGCVAWMFVEKGQIQVPGKATTEDDLLAIALEAGADDITYQAEEGVFVLQTAPDLLNTVCQALQRHQLPVQSAEMTRIPETMVPITDAETAKPLLKLLDVLESLEDVQDVYANLEMDETLLAACLPQ